MTSSRSGDPVLVGLTGAEIRARPPRQDGPAEPAPSLGCIDGEQARTLASWSLFGSVVADSPDGTKHSIHASDVIPGEDGGATIVDASGQTSTMKDFSILVMFRRTERLMHWITCNC